MTKAQVDFIKPGYGKSTTGPNVNRAMKSPQVCAEILDLDEKFVAEVSKLSNYLNSLEPVNESDWQSSACYVYNFYHTSNNREIWDICIYYTSFIYLLLLCL